jgi:D-glycero-D-manno-heptose 1,7-bisphosphate phosphatase
MNSAVFFDRDGVLNELVSRDGGFFSPRTVEDFQIFPEVMDVMSQIKSKGYLCIIVSNQPDIARGNLEKSELRSMTRILSSTLDLDDVFYCLHDDSDECDCRKPAPGLLLHAHEKWDLDLACSFMVGDTARDFEAAQEAGVEFYLLDRTYNKALQVENRIDSLRDIIGFLE